MINSGLETVKGAQPSPESCAPPDFLFGGIMGKKTALVISESPLYRRWGYMKQRCYNKNNKKFHRYGGRGITVCDEWKNNAKSFIGWAISNGYGRGLQIDRINNNGNYEPSNCHFVTNRINNSNKWKKAGLPTGVRSDHLKFQARIRLNDRHFFLGSFVTLEEAGKTYQACVKAFGV